MIAGLARFTTHALAVQLTQMLTNYTSATGTMVPVAVRRAFAPDAPALPEVTVEASPPSELLKNIFGQAGGVDAQGNRYYQLIAEDIRCNLGVRAATPAERDDLFDFIVASLLLGINVSTARQWSEELFTTSGLMVEGVTGTMFAPEMPTDQGQVFTATTTLMLTASVSVSILTTPIATFQVVPNANLQLMF